MLIAFAIYDDAGNANTAAAPVFAEYRDADGNPTVPPPIAHLGAGLYGFTLPPGDAAGRAYLINTGAQPPYLSGYTGSTPRALFSVFDASGAPLEGAAPEVTRYVDGAGTARPLPPVLELGGGLYALAPSSNDIAVGTAYSVATSGFPEHVSGSVGLADFDIPADEPPEVRDIDPPPGSNIGRHSALRLRIVDNGVLRRVYIWAQLEGSQVLEAVHTAEGFTAGYATSERVAHSDGAEFIVRRVAGWVRSPTLKIEAIDNNGNVSVLL